MYIYASIALFLIWAGTAWILSELSKLSADPQTDDVRLVFNEFRLTSGVAFVFMGAYILLKNIVFRDTIIY